MSKHSSGAAMLAWALAFGAPATGLAQRAPTPSTVSCRVHPGRTGAVVVVTSRIDQDVDRLYYRSPFPGRSPDDLPWTEHVSGVPMDGRAQLTFGGVRSLPETIYLRLEAGDAYLELDVGPIRPGSVCQVQIGGGGWAAIPLPADVLRVDAQRVGVIGLGMSMAEVGRFRSTPGVRVYDRAGSVWSIEVDLSRVERDVQIGAVRLRRGIGMADARARFGDCHAAFAAEGVARYACGGDSVFLEAGSGGGPTTVRIYAGGRPF